MGEAGELTVGPGREHGEEGGEPQLRGDVVES